ncbi:MAG: hypothetical protein K9M11_03985 [Candidatus Pacebacteria bacterium]|nr:hypothetical protein [Candidatus Paceibacterota bacterium]
MAVEFEEENVSFNTENTQAAQYEKKVQEKSSLLNQIMMLFFALVCIAASFMLPKFLNPPQTKDVVYFEDLTEVRMRLIPEDERDAYISSLPYRNNKQ